MRRLDTIAVAAAGVIALVGCDQRPPARTSSSASTPAVEWRTAETADGTWSVRWRPEGGEIPSLDPFAVEVEVRDPEGRPIPETISVLVDAAMPHHGHGMNVEPRVERLADVLVEDGGARFRADGMLLHMPGRWEFTVDVVRDGEVERAQWTVVLDD